MLGFVCKACGGDMKVHHTGELKCPYCGEEMKKGSIGQGDVMFPVRWYPEPEVESTVIFPSTVRIAPLEIVRVPLTVKVPFKVISVFSATVTLEATVRLLNRMLPFMVYSELIEMF